MSDQPLQFQHLRAEPLGGGAGGYRIRYRVPGRQAIDRDVLTVADALIEVDALLELLLQRTGGETAFPKLPYVSLYALPAKRGGAGARRWQVSYRIPGRPRQTDRLGTSGAKAYKFAQLVSETIESVRSRTLSADEAYRRLCVDRRHIDLHVEAYEKALVTKGNSAEYVRNTIYRLRESLELMGASRYGHLSRAGVATLQEKLRQRETTGGRALTSQTVNYYLKAVKQFSRWMVKSGRATENPLEHAEGVSVGSEANPRRNVTAEELVAIYGAAMADPFKRAGTMRGPDRAMLYLFGYCTGLRMGELRAVRVEWLKLDGPDADRPGIAVPGSVTKNRKPAFQPLPLWLAAATVKWLDGRSTGPLFRWMHQDMIRPFHKDRESARSAWLGEEKITARERQRREASGFLAYETAQGRLVFHSLRHGYASSLLGTDAETKLVQSLTRHSTIGLLFDRYGHARANRAHAAVEKAFGGLLDQAAGPGGGSDG